MRVVLTFIQLFSSHRNHHQNDVWSSQKVAARVRVHRGMEVGWPRLATGQYRAGVDRARVTLSITWTTKQMNELYIFIDFHVLRVYQSSIDGSTCISAVTQFADKLLFS